MRFRYYLRVFSNRVLTSVQSFMTLEEAMLFAYKFLDNMNLKSFISKFIVYPNFNRDADKIFFKRVYVQVDVPNITIIISRISKHDIDYEKVSDLGRRLLDNGLYTKDDYIKR